MRSVRSLFLKSSWLVWICVAASPLAVGRQTIEEYSLEDRYPISGSTQAWIDLDALGGLPTGGLGVTHADFDGDGVIDVAIGGNSGAPNGAPVKIFYLEVLPGGHMWTRNIEILEYATPVTPACCYQSTTPGSGCTGCSAGPFAFTQTGGCYGIETADYNQDGHPDLAIGRRNAANFAGGQRDTVWLNDGSGTLRFDATTPIPLRPTADPSGLTSDVRGQTFGIESTDVDNDGDADVVSVGAYGIRVYLTANSGGTTTFTHNRTYTEPGTSSVYRNLVFGDVDSDGDPDMVVVRAGDVGGGFESDRVWFNQRVGAATTPSPAAAPFALNSASVPSVPPTLKRGTIRPMLWQAKSTSPCPSASGSVGDFSGSFDCDLGDLDGDGDLDLAVASATGDNVAYVNNGVGVFGSNGNGDPTYTFVTPTADWPSSGSTFASSRALARIAFTQLTGGTPTFVPPTGCTGATDLDFEFHVPGKALDYTTSVRVADVNGDGRNDVSFANRNDLHDATYVAQLAYGVPQPPAADPLVSANSSNIQYLSPDHPAALVPDYVYYGIEPTGSNVFEFCDIVERVGMDCDGTSYFEYVDLDGDGRLDWIESNFNNEYLYDQLFGEHMQRRVNSYQSWLPTDYEPYTVEHLPNTFIFFGRDPSQDDPPIAICPPVGP